MAPSCFASSWCIAITHLLSLHLCCFIEANSEVLVQIQHQPCCSLLVQTIYGWEYEELHPTCYLLHGIWHTNPLNV
jgi:hypothetical protein